MIRRIFTFILAMVFVILCGQNAFAISSSELQSLNNNTFYYQPGNTCSPSTPVTAGSGPAGGTAYPNLDPNSMANAINAYIKQYSTSSDFTGDGSTFVSDGYNSNVSPFLMVAIAEIESSLASPTTYDVQYANNAFSREATSGQPHIQGAGPNADTLWYKWPSVIASIQYQNPTNIADVGGGGGDFAAYLRESFATQIDTDNLTSFFATYDPGNSAYPATVQNIINQLVTMTGSATTTATTITPTAANDCSATSLATGTGTPAGLANFVYYSQCDSAWANDPYGDDPVGTICADGCGPTSVAMVIATLANNSVTPVQSANLAMQLGEYDPGAGTDWSFFINGPAYYHLKATSLGTNFAQAIATLNEGGLVIAAGTGAAPFTTEGHIIVLKGEASNGDIIVADPDTAHTQTEYSVNDIISAGLQDLVGVTQ